MENNFSCGRIFLYVRGYFPSLLQFHLALKLKLDPQKHGYDIRLTSYIWMTTKYNLECPITILGISLQPGD
jgi:hypothetical protein